MRKCTRRFQAHHLDHLPEPSESDGGDKLRLRAFRRVAEEAGGGARRHSSVSEGSLATPDVYKRLHSEFLELWGDPMAASLCIDVFTPSRICEGFKGVPDEPPFDRGRYELLAEVCVPTVPDGGTFTQFGFAVLRKDDQAVRVQQRFRTLCAEAGAYLPPHFRDRLAGYCPWHVTKQESWWVALLLYLTGEAVRLPDGRSREHILLPRSVLLSVDAIERYGLATDSPNLPVAGGDVTREAPAPVAPGGQAVGSGG